MAVSPPSRLTLADIARNPLGNSAGLLRMYSMVPIEL